MGRDVRLRVKQCEICMVVTLVKRDDECYMQVVAVDLVDSCSQPLEEVAGS